ncbi:MULTISPECIES: aspartate--tRNA(Asn) ligase [unclassified Fusibacter]|uniref:aspartate--tRNA(Asn) ligase n=1 Tax=unclassified Fusibacter TaxID=2624464 RepID=UPI001010599E|nr:MULTISPECIES: aspartate--tRNA(Asn) ligase [unclassified Fusibacter]MCK8060401.1 aspartate--tRNA(Asn) ligase [Fusibacter sp. A2]NPE20310.1 aspartate--tRNA(Asn) ligase [Fusibacter sp. A1]RXV63516.1 aspartate--tRNA(Asn) ligase [Fusibacter sp. A1]
MKRTMIKSLNEHVNQTVKISGWVHRIRKLKAVVFVILRDRTGLIQVAMSPQVVEEADLRLEAVVSVTGTVVENQNKLGPIELQATAIEVLSKVSEDLPIQINGQTLEAGLETILNHRVLALRHQMEQATFKIQAALCEGFANFLRANEFTEIHTPKLVKEGAEGGAGVFSLDYFGQTAYLAQSPQFYKQMMVVAGMERVFEIGSVFRAESHSTSRHLNEYVSMDLEMGFITSEGDLMDLETQLLSSMLEHVRKTCEGELELLEVALPDVPESIPRMKLSQAIEILKDHYGKTELEGDLDPEGEKLIAAHVKELTGSDFLFLTHYPRTKRPMYTKACGESETHSFDLLFKGLEITTGGLRIHEEEALSASMRYKGLESENYASYLETFRYGAPPHGGLAIGLERITAQLLGYKNIRRATLFPRDNTRLTP